MKTKEVVTFRMPADMRQEWEAGLKATGVTESELVRACIHDGFKTAILTLLNERKAGEEELEQSEQAECGHQFGGDPPTLCIYRPE